MTRRINSSNGASTAKEAQPPAAPRALSGLPPHSSLPARPAVPSASVPPRPLAASHDHDKLREAALSSRRIDHGPTPSHRDPPSPNKRNSPPPRSSRHGSPRGSDTTARREKEKDRERDPSVDSGGRHHRTTDKERAARDKDGPRREGPDSRDDRSDRNRKERDREDDRKRTRRDDEKRRDEDKRREEDEKRRDDEKRAARREASDTRRPSNGSRSETKADKVDKDPRRETKPENERSTPVCPFYHPLDCNFTKSSSSVTRLHRLVLILQNLPLQQPHQPFRPPLLVPKIHHTDFLSDLQPSLPAIA